MIEQAKIYVKPGEGVKVPLPIPGGPKVPAVGLAVVETIAVTRLITAKDLVVCEAPEAGEPVTMKTSRGSAHSEKPAAETVQGAGAVTAAAEPAAPAVPAATAKGEK